MTTPFLRRWVVATVCGLIAIQGDATIVGAQATGVVRGTVVDSVDRAPVVGATITILGTRMGAATDANGRYTIRAAPAVPQTRAVTIPAQGEVVADFVASRGVVQLQQVVTTVTGAQRTVELGHAIS